jgi:hypothetical protein
MASGARKGTCPTIVVAACLQRQRIGVGTSKPPLASNALLMHCTQLLWVRKTVIQGNTDYTD